jgi:hypothetical protein
VILPLVSGTFKDKPAPFTYRRSVDGADKVRPLFRYTQTCACTLAGVGVC